VNSATVYLDGAGTQGGVSNGLAMTADGTLYYTCNPDGSTINSICVQAAKADGASGSKTSYYLRNSAIALGPISGGLALDADEVLFHGDPTTKQILRISETNTADIYTPDNAWDSCGSDAASPRALAFDSSGNLFVGNDNCGVWVVPSNTSGGSTTSSGGTPRQIFADTNTASATYCQRAYALSLDSAGNTYVGCNNGNSISSSIIKLTKSGATYTAARYIDLGLYPPQGLAFDSEDFIYVMARNEFKKFVSVSGTLTEYRSTYGGMNPFAMTVDRLGNAYVASDNNIIKFIGVGIPYPPRGLTAVAGNSQVTLSWRNIGMTGIDTFTVTASPGGAMCTTNSGSANPYSCSVSGLTNGTAYSFVVRAANGTGTSLPSSSVSSTPVGGPGAPTIGTATAYDSTTATVTFTAPASNGGSAITSYVATAFPGGETGTLVSANSGTIYIYGLATNVAETFTVVAINALGTSAPSAASNSITPLITTTPPVAPSQSTQTGVPSPQQRSEILSINPLTCYIGVSTEIVISGRFYEPLTNINIGKVNLPVNSWRQSESEVAFTFSASQLGEYQIQLYNGSIPLLAVQKILVVEKPVTAKPTEIVKPSEAVKPIENTQPNSTMKKIATLKFGLGASALTQKQKSSLTKIVAMISDSSFKTVLLYGHADIQPGVDNALLSKKRAKSVQAFMKPLLPDRKLKIGWFAATKPAVKGNTPAAYSKNRRVEVWVK
jgi:outer membrane protein OmpA-like peptidoglycan-associated protein